MAYLIKRSVKKSLDKTPNKPLKRDVAILSPRPLALSLGMNNKRHKGKVEK